MLYPDGDDAQKFWVSQARNAFTAFTLYLFENYDVEWRLNVARESLRFPTLGEVYRLSSGDGADLRAPICHLEWQCAHQNDECLATRLFAINGGSMPPMIQSADQPSLMYTAMTVAGIELRPVS